MHVSVYLCLCHYIKKETEQNPKSSYFKLKITARTCFILGWMKAVQAFETLAFLANLATLALMGLRFTVMKEQKILPIGIILFQFASGCTCNIKIDEKLLTSPFKYTEH